MPTQLVSLNKGLPTLQFQSLSVSPFNVNILPGGAQDNGTWQTQGNPVEWENTMIGDGGQSGFDAADPAFRFHTFFNATPDVNFSRGDIADWNWIADQIYFGGEPQSFYVPIISDPVVTRSMFVGLGHVWRTKTWGMGALDLATFRQRCNEWFGVFDNFCGDWEPLGATTYVPPPFPFLPNPGTYAATRLTASGALYGTDRPGGFVAAVERTTGDMATLWAATSTGRLFHLEERGRRPGERRHVQAPRQLGNQQSQQVRQRHSRRSGEPEPCLGVLQRIQCHHGGHSRTRVRGDVQPCHRHRCLGRSQP